MSERLQWQVGEVKITRVFETVISTAFMSRIVRGSTPEELLAIPWLRPHFIDEKGNMLGSIHALVLEAGGKRVIVDTCVGNDRDRDHPVGRVTA